MLKLSPSSLNVYLECPRCFWLRFVKGIKRPEGPASTLPSGVDYTLKNHYDSWRAEGLPPELESFLKGKARLLRDQALANEMRRIGYGVSLGQDVWFGGALDDALELGDGAIVPLDNKSKGFPPYDPHWTHVAQMSGYTLILQEKGLKTRPIAYLAHWFLDHKHMVPENPLKFRIRVDAVKTDPERIRAKIFEAAAALEGPMPEPGSKSGRFGTEACAFCAYGTSGRGE